MEDIRKCCNRFYAGVCCPNCGEKSNNFVLEADRRRSASKFLSGILRHYPDDYDLEIDQQGWVSTVEVLKACSEKYNWIESEQILGIIATDNKGRFEVDNHRIRASYGHSIDHIDLEDNNRVVPDLLYHGTANSNVRSIMEDGLKPMNRQEVHMTDDKGEALNVASRHSSDNVLLVIDAKQMMDDNHTVVKRGDIIYTSSFVPPQYIDKTD
jgi:putative RNA 2'-phosphotransferase